MAAKIEIQGQCDPRFERVRQAFADNFEKRGEVGAAVAVTVGGHPVADFWAGHADAARTRPWQRDTIVNVWSTTKGLCALCAHRLADQGRLDFEAPVAKYWPEFAAAGKANLPVKYLLSHRAGMAAIQAPLKHDELFSWEKVTSELARQEPWWEPGTRHGYHAITFGWLVGEVVHRISGKSLGSYFRDEIATPLGADAYIGFGPSLDSRVADILPSPPPKPGEPNPFMEMMKDPNSVSAKAIGNPPTMMLPETTNSRAWRAAEIPGANGHSTARALARIYGALACGGEVDGVKIVSSSSLKRFYTEQSRGTDEVLKFPTRFSLGYMLSQAGAQFGPNQRSFGHPGAGGSLGFADLDATVGFGYAMNQMGAAAASLLDPRCAALIDAVYASL
ncbi:MAG TPA: serine hydrolase domain-containing protein [Candidatus Binataceae bacterium]|nr:serine hydrolase domain-containing protein [Candidatus Binataceae bacterium]